MKQHNVSYNSTNYLPFQISERTAKNANTLLKQTKNVILNSRRYNRFLQNYTHMTQTHSFKLPEISIYPVLKNTEIVSMNKQSFDLNYEKDLFNSTAKVGFRSDSIKPNSTYSNGLKTNKPPLSDIKKTQFESSRLLRNCKSIDVNIKLVNKLDIHTLCDLAVVLQECLYHKYCLDNSEEEIANTNKEALKAKIVQMATGDIQNDTMIMTKVYNTSGFDKVELTLKSIEISLVSEDGISISTLLPFCILPILFYSTLEAFKLFLAKIIKFDIDFKTFTIDYEILKKEISLLSNIFVKHESYGKIYDNEIKLDWVTPIRTFKLRLKMPIAIFHIPHKFLTFHKYVDRSLMVYIFLKNFINWDSYTLTFLGGFKMFRDNLNSMFNKKNSIIVDHEPNTISLDKKPNDKISLIESKYFEFMYTDNLGEGAYYRLKAYNIFVRIKEFKKPKRINKFEFNFKDMRTLNRVKEFWPLEYYINRNLVIDYKNQIVNLGFKDLSNITDEYFKMRVNGSENTGVNNNNLEFHKTRTKGGDNDSSTIDQNNKIKIYIDEPHIVKYETEHGLDLRYVSKLPPEEVINELCRGGNWAELLAKPMANFDSFENFEIENVVEHDSTPKHIRAKRKLAHLKSGEIQFNESTTKNMKLTFSTKSAKKSTFVEFK